MGPHPFRMIARRLTPHVRQRKNRRLATILLKPRARGLSAFAAAILTLFIPGANLLGADASPTDPGGTRFSPLDQINTGNVQNLGIAWIYRTGERSAGTPGAVGHNITAFESTPLIVGETLYLTTASSRVIALNAETGKELWQFDPQKGSTHRRSAANRGVAYWNGGSGGAPRIVYGTADGRLIELDAATGKPCADFGDNGVVNLRAGVADAWPNAPYYLSSPPAIYRNLVITGSSLQEDPSKGPGGVVRAFDVRTGKPVWTFHTVPQPGEFGHDTWKGDSWKDRSGANVWSLMSVDEKRGLVFLPLGSATYDFYGADRKGDNLFANSLVALDANTGRRVWHFQVIHHDIWDYDLPAQPVLATVLHNGREVPAVAQVTKSGYVFVFDRTTGRPLFPIEERKVPPSSVPGEQASPTQPFPLKPPPLALQQVTAKDLSDVAPASAQYCSALFHTLTGGSIFTPYGLTPTLVMPGTLGGGTWSGGSYDPKTHYLFVNENNVGAVGMMKKDDKAGPGSYHRWNEHGGAYARFWDEHGWPCQKPPWGTLSAVDLDRGEVAWTVPLGVVDELKGRPATGAPNLGGSIVTAGGIVFIGASTDQRFRAFSAKTGQVLWEARLEASAHATPATYLGQRSGRQFVVIAAGGGGFFQGPVSDTLVAFTLKDSAH